MVGGMSVQRIDRGELQKPSKLANGWLRVDGKLTRTGVFAYRLGDGKVRRELRLPEEVFHADALESFGLVPVTDEHPPAFLDAANTKEFARGAVAAGPRQSGRFVVGELLVTDAALIEKLESGTARELSCGYNCDLEEEAGVSEDGEHYDAIQRNIRGNHVAVVQKGRAGPEARVRMDGAGVEIDTSHDRVISISPQNHPGPEWAVQKGHVHMKIRIDGVDYEVSNEQTVQAFARLEKQRADALAAAESAAKTASEVAEKLQAKLDEAGEALKKKDAELAELPKKIAEKIAARSGLETKARQVLGAKAKLDGDDAKLRIAVIQKINPAFDGAGKSEAYIEARFDAALETFADGECSAQVLSDARTAVDPAENTDATEEVDADAAYQKMRKDNADAWKRTLKRGGIEV